MSYFDDASLVMIPSGYKTSKVYSVKPTDGSGDLTFSRSNDTATRVNSAGLIEKVRTNLVLQSQAFENASWIKINATATANSTTAPDGTLTADTILAPLASATAAYQGISSQGAMTLSLYAKANTSNFISLTIFDVSPAADYMAIFDLSNGTFIGNGGLSSVDSYIIENAGNGWYRLSVTKNVGAVGNHNYVVGVAKTGNSPVPVAGTSVFVWGAQVEASDFGPTPYIPTTSAAVSVGPVANVPRLDYLNSSCPRLLLEPQRTNLVTYSEQFANWQNAGGTTTANTAISPSGYQDADTLTGARFQSGFGSNQYTASCFAKKVDGDGKFVLRIDVPTLKFAQFNLNNGTIDSTSAGYTSTITPYGNGWYRCTITTPASTSISNYVIVSASGGASNTYIWGAQLEAGAYATSYIPTLGASVTRGADACSKTGISSLTSASEYTIYWEGTHIPTGEYNSFATFYNNANNNDSARFYRNNTDNQIRAAFFNSATGLALDLASGVTTQTAKCAVRVKAGSYALYVNGVLVNSSTSALAPASNLDAVNLQYFSSGQSFDQKTGQVLFFKTALSNADLAALTA